MKNGNKTAAYNLLLLNIFLSSTTLKTLEEEEGEKQKLYQNQ